MADYESYSLASCKGADKTMTEELQRTLFPEDKPEALNPTELRALFDLVDWGVVIQHSILQDFSLEQKNYLVCLFKAYALMFLITIPSERALERELADKASLRELCGFRENQTATGNTLRRFRQNVLPRFTTQSPGIYTTLFPHILIALVIAAIRLQLKLPFVFGQAIEDDLYTQEDISHFYLADLARTEITIFPINVQPNGGVPKKKRGIDEYLNLPLRFRIATPRDTHYDCVINNPPWLNTFRGAESVPTISGSATMPYAACNVIILRQTESGVQEVLMGRRVSSNNNGNGNYVLPGGKQQPPESLQECAIREVAEETGIIVLESSPISLKFRFNSNHAPVASVGVYVTKYVGSPRVKDSAVSEWGWFPLTELPYPIFPPSWIVLEHFKSEYFKSLTWEVVSTLAEEFITLEFRRNNRKNDDDRAKQLYFEFDE